MADLPNVLHRDSGLKPHSKLPPMSTPGNEPAGPGRTAGASRLGPLPPKGRTGADGSVAAVSTLSAEGVSEGSLPFLGSVPPNRSSSFGKGAEGTSAASAVDYQDVFGGPPRYATSMFASQAGPSSALDDVFRTTARVPSFKASSLPVFELPVFGDGALGGSTYGARPPAVAYEDIFNEGGTPEAFPVMNLSVGLFTGASRSKPSSRSSSRRISPVHPAASASHPVQEDVCNNTTNAAGTIKPRPAAGKVIRRCSFSSFSSFDESGGKQVDSPFTALRSDPVTSSLPSSPPRAGHWDHLKKPVRLNSGNSVRIGFDTETDDVFGGFPQRSSLIFSQPFTGGQREASDNTRSSRTHGAGSVEKPSMKGFTPEGSSSAVDKDDISSNADPALSGSPSSTDEQGLNDDFIEIRMNRHNDGFASEKGEGALRKPWIKVGDVNLSTPPSSKPPPARPPPAPAAQIKFKSWKDWASELPTSHANTVVSAEDCVGLTPATPATPVMEMDEGGDGDASSGYVKNWVDAISISLPGHRSAELKLPAVGEKSKSKSARETVEMEERELQAMLANAWKVNEEREREKMAAQPVLQSQEGSEENERELHRKEWRRHLNGQFKVSQAKQEVQVGPGSREADILWKKWRKYPTRERIEEVMKDNIMTDKDAQNVSKVIEQVSVHLQDRLGSVAATTGISGVEGTVFREETSQVVANDTSTKLSMSATELPMSATDLSRTGTDLKKTPPKDVAGAQERTDVTMEEQSQAPNSPERFSNTQTPVNGGATMPKPTKQDSVQGGEYHEVLASEGAEDLESLLASSLDGFEEMEGESIERRKSRWERHVRARERVARALEEKQQRDADVQREQAEKQRLAEASDHQIKRWATGKEGNLRALLSNLQHVLWPDSGWQPVPLTDLIEGAAVKKAYRKATLFVHPDKVQQKGATLQQKYVAERVFDILQEAWKTFNIQELF